MIEIEPLTLEQTIQALSWAKVGVWDGDDARRIDVSLEYWTKRFKAFLVEIHNFVKPEDALPTGDVHALLLDGARAVREARREGVIA